MRCSWSRRAVLAAAFAATVLGSPALAQQKMPLKIAVGGMACLCYLPTVLAEQLGLYEKHGLDAELINFKGGSVALTAVLGGSADVVSGYYDHCVNLKAKKKDMKSVVVYDQFPGLVLVVSPKATGTVKGIKDLVGKKVGVSAPGSSTDFFLKYLLKKSGVDPGKVAVIGVGLDDTAVAAQEQGQVDAAVMLDPAVTLLQGKYKDLKILADTRTEKDTLALFGGKYPGGSIYATTDWVSKHPKESQAIANALVDTLRWIHSHSAQEIMAKMPKEIVGPNPDLYLAALKNALPMYSKDGRMDPKGAQAVLDVFSQSVPDIAKAKVDLSTTYTDEFVDNAHRRRDG
ncbi:MAG TPA: ABC transporter substrate-binding protein [Myxococcaceae bacterium]|nr:ABC transporter substrate-binding protein [Myxococcaceae bacterium]